MKNTSRDFQNEIQLILNLLDSSNPAEAIELLKTPLDGTTSIFRFFRHEFHQPLFEALKSDPSLPENPYKILVLNIMNVQEQRDICRDAIDTESQKVLKFKKAEVVQFLSIAEFLSHLFPEDWKKSTNCPHFNLLTSKAAEKLFNSRFTEELPIEKPEDVHYILEYWQVLIDEIILEEIQSAILYDGFILQLDENGMATNTWPWEMENFSKLEEIKNSIRTRIYQNWNSNEVSKDAHFKSIDPNYHTDQGVASILYSDGIEITQSDAPGPAIKVEGAQEEWVQNAMMAQLRQAMFTYYRWELEKNFVPKEFHPIRSSEVKINGEVFKSHTLVALTSFLTSFSRIACDGFPAQGEKAFFSDFFADPKYKNEAGNPTIFDLANFALQFSIHESFHKEFAFEEFTIDQVHSLILNNENLKHLSEKQLVHIFKYLAKEKFTPGILLIDDRIFLIHNMILASNLSNALIQRTILPKLFPREDEVNDKEPEHKKREKGVCVSLGKMIENSGFKVLVNHTFENPTFKEEGEFDLLALSEEEKLALVIEVKLRNGGNLGRKGKSDWAAARILEAIAQLEKDIRLFEESDEGLKIGKTHFNLNLQGYRFEYLILTDNFICDHQIRTLNNMLPYETKVVSIFEVQCLLNEDFTDPLIVELRNSIKDSKGRISLKKFIEALLENHFWKTLIQPELKTALPEFGTYRINPRFKLQY